LTDGAVLEHERKQVTVLFADTTGSTELVADRDPEEAQRLLAPILELMMEAVHLYEGTVNRVMGDGIMALFGAPVAFEDHALRACYSALKMQELVKKYAELVRRTEGLALHIRVGLNSGEVAARAAGGDIPVGYSVDGQAVHLAARMEQLATPGTILIAPTTFHLTEGYVTTKALGPMVVKGLAAPVETYELLGATGLRSRLQVAAAQGLSRFVGRQSEIARLREARDEAWAGRGQVVGILGEPGVGKSRMLHEFVRSEATSWRILESGAVSYGAAASYLPVTEFLRGYFQITSSDEPAVVREKVTSKLLSLDERLSSALPALLMVLDLPQEDLPSSTLALPQRRRSALDAVKRLLFRESEVQPVMLILEDLHTVDPDTQALIDGLVDSLPTARILLVASYRPEYRHGWSGKTYYTHIRIDPLNTAGAREMLSALIGDDSALDPLRRLLLEKTAGNPLFIEESVRALVESGALSGKPGAYSVTKPVSDLEVPASVESLLASRIDRLHPADKKLLQCAAVVGHHVPLRVLQAVQNVPADQLRQGIERLQTSELLYETSLFPDLEYMFRHALIHDVAYKSLPLDRRRALHTAALVAGEQLEPDQTLERAEWLAFHAFRGEVWDRAVSYYRSAAARAISRAANRLAVRHLENALVAAGHLCGDDSASVEADLRIDLRHALTPLGQVQRMLEHLRAAEALVAPMGDRSRLGRIVSFTANCLLTQAQYAEALATGARALAIAQELHDESLEIATRIYMARALLGRGECRQAIEMLHGTIRLLDEKPCDEFLGLPVLPAAYARSVLAASLAEIGEFEEAAAHAAEAAHRSSACGQPDSMLWANWSVGLVALLRGDSEYALRVFDNLLELCRTHDLDAYLPRIMAALGCSKCRSGRVDEGLQLLEQAVRSGSSAEPRTARSFALIDKSEALFLSGDYARALTAATEAVEFTRDHQERGAEAYARLVRGLIGSTQLAESESAYDDLCAASTVASELNLLPLLAHSHLGVGEMHKKRGDSTRAREYIERGQRLVEALGIKQWFRFDGAADSGPRSGLSA
jgi:class 3 adenylate cyclase/tetratricopeptide (TPR) repeat protein